jgi:hypothetical protein
MDDRGGKEKVGVFRYIARDYLFLLCLRPTDGDPDGRPTDGDPDGRPTDGD